MFLIVIDIFFFSSPLLKFLNSNFNQWFRQHFNFYIEARVDINKKQQLESPLFLNPHTAFRYLTFCYRMLEVRFKLVAKKINLFMDNESNQSNKETVRSRV